MEASHTREAVAGRAIGAMIFAGFGTLWLVTGLQALHLLNATTGVALGLVCAALVIPAVLLIGGVRRSGGGPRDADEDARIWKRYRSVNLWQWIAIIAAVVVLIGVRRSEYLVPAIATIIGLHFFPLARLFRYPPHSVTGALMVAWSVAVVLAFGRAQWAPVGAIGTAAIMLASAANSLVSALLSSRQALRES